MKEDYLHYLWKFRLINQSNLETSGGEPLEIIHPGVHNSDSGPDFQNARIRIGSTIWAGSVEIHIRGSDWFAHNHSTDPAYENVILHVVWEHDQSVQTAYGQLLPTLELKGRCDVSRFKILEQWQENSLSIPCGYHLSGIEPIIVQNCLEQQLLNRLKKKVKALQSLFVKLGGNWEELFYHLLLKNFGLRINTEAFSELALRLPYRILRKHRHNLLEIESLLFGTAGIIPASAKDPYIQHLQGSFDALAKKWNLHSMHPHQWRFMRTRPMNFPTLRIAQVASLISKYEGLFSTFIQLDSTEILIQKLHFSPSEYWKHHYRFGDQGLSKSKQSGNVLAQNIIINTIVPMLFLYGKETLKEHYCSHALHLLETTAGESNSVTRRWKACGLAPQSAFESQAMIELYQHACLEKKCLTCNIGIHLLRNS